MNVEPATLSPVAASKIAIRDVHKRFMTPTGTVYEALGGTRKLLEATIAPIDPLTRADLLKERKVLIVGAKNDEIVPAKMAENLWKASGQQKILWLDAGHFSAALYLIPGLHHVVEHFK